MGRECSGDDAQGACSKRGDYTKFSTKCRAEIVKYAAEHGVAATVRHFCTNSKYPNLKERCGHADVNLSINLLIYPHKVG